MNELKPFDLEKFEVNKNLFIEASAGTGKTYSIKEIVAKLVQNNIPLSKILLVTYTEKAAGELKDRIQEKLLENNIKEDVDKATIGTIHSFCQKTLSDFAYEANVPFSLSLLNGMDMSSFIDILIREDYAKEITEKKSDADKVKSLFLSALEKYNPEIQLEKTFSSFDDLLSNLEDTHPFKTNFKILEKYPNVEFKAKGCKSLNSVSGLTEAIKTGIENSEGTLFKYNRTSAFEYLENENIPELEIALNYFYGIRKENPFELSKPEHTFVTEKLPEVYQKFQAKKEELKLLSFDDMILNVRNAVCSSEGVSPLCKKLRETYRYAIIDEFQDTNQNQWDIFRTVFLHDHFSEIKNNIIVVGDPKQSIYSFQGADLSVYFKAVAEIQKNGEGYRLSTNYRSSKSMIDACNNLFQQTENYWKTAESKNNISFAPSQFPSEKTDTPYFLDKKENAPIWILEAETEKQYAETIIQKIVECLEFKNEKTRLQIFDKDLKKYRNVKFSDFAILAKSRSEIETIETCMAKTGIPFVRYKDQGLFVGLECLLWLNLLKAIQLLDYSGKNTGLLRQVFFGDFFRIPLSVLETHEIEDFPELLLTIQEWKFLIETKRFAELQESIYAKTEIDKYLRSKFKFQQLAKIKQIGSYIFEYFYNNNASLDEVIRHLEGLSIKTEESDVEDGNYIAKVGDFDAIQVMTIHASKGLQFPVVISFGGIKDLPKNADAFLYKKEDKKYLGFSKNAKAQNEIEVKEELRRLFYVNYTRAESLLVYPIFEKWNGTKKEDNSDKSPYRFLYKSKNEIKESDFCLQLKIQENPDYKTLKEKVRQILSGQKNISDNSDYPDIKSFQKELKNKIITQYSYSNLSMKLDTNISEISDNDKTKDENFSEDTEILKEKIQATDIDKNNCTKFFTDLKTTKTQMTEFDSYPKGSALGNALHNIFEIIDFENIGNLKSDTEALENADLQNIIIKKFNDEYLNISKNKNWQNKTTRIIWNTLNAKLPEIQGNQYTEQYFQLKTLNEKDKLTEMEFYFNAENKNTINKLCKGFIDLLFKRNGRYSILDWKSDFLENYQPETLKEKVDTEYSVQRVLYSYLLIQWLKAFYPEMSEQEIFENYFGGIYYVFLRGTETNSVQGIYSQTWESFEALNSSFENVKKLMI